MDKDKDAEVEWVNWFDLPFHLMGLILLKLVFIKDFIRFGSVCKSWHIIYKQNRDDYLLHLPPQLPILLVTTEPVPDDHTYETRSFYDLSGNRVCKFPLPVPHFDYYHAIFPSEGWIIGAHGSYNENVILYNPFLSVDNVITLPNLDMGIDPMSDDFQHLNHIRKAVLSTNPSVNPNFMVLATLRNCSGRCRNLAFYKSEYNCGWTYLLDDVELFIVDVIYYENQFYAMDHNGLIRAIDLSSSIPIVSIVAPCIGEEVENYGDCVHHYLVESFGELLGVKRNWSSKDSHFTLNFQVFRLDQSMFKWIEIKSLGRRSLFIGGNTSISITASDFPRCKPNCIYFTHEGRDNDIDCFSENFSHDMGVYNLEDGSIEPHYPMESIQFKYPSPMWIEPRFIK